VIQLTANYELKPKNCSIVPYYMVSDDFSLHTPSLPSQAPVVNNHQQDVCSK